MAKYESIKNDLYKFWENNPEKQKKEIADHFIVLGYAKSTVYNWIKSLETNGSLERKISCGRPVIIASKANIRYIKKGSIIVLVVLNIVLLES